MRGNNLAMPSLQEKGLNLMLAVGQRRQEATIA